MQCRFLFQITPIRLMLNLNLNRFHRFQSNAQSKSIPVHPFTTVLFHPSFHIFTRTFKIFFKDFQYNISQLHQFILGLITAKPKGKKFVAAHLDTHNPILAPLLRVQLGLLHARNDTKRCQNIYA